MAKHLTDADIAKYVEILDEWDLDDKLSWDNYVSTINAKYGSEVTRQTLYKKTRIKNAFTSTKKAIAEGGNGKKNKTDKSLPSSLKVAARQIESRDRRIDRLEAENNALLEQFHIWLYNANRLKITIEELNRPLQRSKK